MTNPSRVRCQAIPLPDSQISLQIDGVERLRWHFGAAYPRPFFYPLIGPSGHCLIRMGHPGAPNHDHHRGIWFAHQNVAGNDFWIDQSPARIRQLEWLCYEDSDTEARLAVKLGWFDGHDPRPLLEQTMIAAIRPAAEGAMELEIQTSFLPVSQQLEFGQTNFGFLGVRVAKSISAWFGDGTIADSEGRQGEPAIFGQPARWMDYSGAVDREGAVEGITYFDHPHNPGYPTCWHVREDGWMIAAPCMQSPLATSQTFPLTLRYLLHAHRGPVQAARCTALSAAFADAGLLQVHKSSRKHTAYEIDRQS